jgi:glycosyltransferase involved in cell wall biosynthesis
MRNWNSAQPTHPFMKVSVLIMTYNHAPFIAQALDSALMQATNFPYEIIVSEDCSTDGTREIVQTYHNRFPEKIRLMLSERNIATNAIVVRGIEAARGQYVALLDGDDYWISAEKLQKQADFLDSHSHCAMCFHNATVIHEDSSEEARLWTPEHQPELTSLEAMIYGWATTLPLAPPCSAKVCSNVSLPGTTLFSQLQIGPCTSSMRSTDK